MTAAPVGRRVRSLLAAATGPDQDVATHWRAWRSGLPGGLDECDGIEVALLPTAWERARSTGQDDPDIGRLRGLQRRTSVQVARVVAKGADAQERLAVRGIPSALSGGAALAVWAGRGRRPVDRAELTIPPALTAAAVGRVGLSDRIRGRAFLSPDVVVRWHRPDRDQAPIPPAASVVREWQARSLRVVDPHHAAFHVLLHRVIPYRAGDARQAPGLLDVWSASTHPDFDDIAFTRLVTQSRWRPALAATAAAWASVLPTRTTALVAGDPTGSGLDLTESRWGRTQSRTVAAVAGRVRPR